MTAHRSLRPLFALFLALGLVLAACGDDGGDGGDASGGDNGGEFAAEREAYLEALVDDIESDEPFEGFEEAAPCLAAALIDTVGVERLIDEDIAVEEFADADSLADFDIELDDDGIAQLSAAFDDCIDLRQLMTNTAPEGFGCLVDTIDMDALSRAIAEEFATGESFDPSTLMFESATPACAEEAFLATGVSQGDITADDAECVAENLEDGVALRVLQSVAETGSPDQDAAAALEAAFTACGVSP